MGTVMAVDRYGLTIGTEVGIMADGTLITITRNVAAITLVLAKRSVTVYAVVNWGTPRGILDRFVDGGEAVARVDVFGALNTGRAVIPVRTSQTFVADTNNALWKVSPAYT
jgi:hypothetical protein